MLALLLGVALTALPTAIFSMLLFSHMERLNLPLVSLALFDAPHTIGLFLGALARVLDVVERR